MPVTVKYFASLREHHGAGRQLEAPDAGTTVADIWATASDGAALPDNVLMAVNLEYVAPIIRWRTATRWRFFRR